MTIKRWDPATTFKQTHDLSKIPKISNKQAPLEPFQQPVNSISTQCLINSINFGAKSRNLVLHHIIIIVVFVVTPKVPLINLIDSEHLWISYDLSYATSHTWRCHHRLHAKTTTPAWVPESVVPVPISDNFALPHGIMSHNSSENWLLWQFSAKSYCSKRARTPRKAHSILSLIGTFAAWARALNVKTDNKLLCLCFWQLVRMSPCQN